MTIFTFADCAVASGGGSSNFAPFPTFVTLATQGACIVIAFVVLFSVIATIVAFCAIIAIVIWHLLYIGK